MAAYIIANLEVLDPEGFQEYRKRVGPIIEQYGGRYLVRGGNHEVLEGQQSPGSRLVVIEFPSFAQAKEWYLSREYQEIIPFRQESARGELTIVEGV